MVRRRQVMALTATRATETNPPETEAALSRRERQVMDILFEVGRATGAEMRRRLPDCPSYSSVRTILRILERKGHVRHLEAGMQYVYVPTVEREAAMRAAVQRLVTIYFNGSIKTAVAVLLGLATELPDEDRRDVERAIHRETTNTGSCAAEESPSR